MMSKTSARTGHDMGSVEKWRILVIDDNPSIHEDFRKIFSSRLRLGELSEMEAALFGSDAEESDVETIQIDSAMQGREGLELVRLALGAERPYQVAFVDVRMPPGWNGVETVKRIWEFDPDVQVVICTAYSDYTWREIVDQLGQSDRWVVLKKPFDVIEVRQLASALTRKWELLRDNRLQLKDLERLVTQRTQRLEETNGRLLQELDRRSKLEADLRRAHKLESLGRLVAGLGHEVNNPLCYLFANLSFLAEEVQKLKQDLPFGHLEDAESYLRDAQDGADRIRRIVGELRDFSHLEDQEKRPVDIRLILDAAVDMVQNEARHRARVVKELGDLPLVVGDRGRLKQVFVNILLNATQAIPEGNATENEIRIAARPESPETIAVEISDTGFGISEQDLERIFDPFFTTKPVGEGRGLGLSVCHGIVTALDGEIGVWSRPGEGTTVRVILPCSMQKMTERASCPGDEAGALDESDPLRILIVDDEPLVARSLSRMLMQHNVSICHSGREALERCMERDFEVVICDLMMDDLTGMDFYKELCQLRPGQEKRIIFITGGAFTRDSNHFIKNTPNRCITKPIQEMELKAVIQEVLGGSQETSDGEATGKGG